MLKKLGKRNPIRVAREGAKLTQAQLGDRVGVTGSAISAYETGRDRPSPDVAVALCRELPRLSLAAIYRQVGMAA